MQTRRHSEPSIGPVECWHATPTLFVGKHNSIKNGLLAHPPNPSPDPCGYADVVVPLVLSRCAGLAFWSLTEKQEMERTVESISQTLGAGLLEYFCTTLLDAWEDNEPISHTDFDMAHIHCTVQDIETLQAELQATEDEDEQRALEEDITGKILWFFRCGIRAELNEIVAMVLNYTENSVGGLSHTRLHEIAEIIERIPHRVPDDTLHLQRVMHDAGTGVSRYRLWLDARTAEQARLSRGLAGNPEGTAPITSP